MKKKIILIALLIAAIALPLTAASSLDLSKASKGQFGAGLNLGTCLGAAVKFDNAKWDLYGNIGFGVIGKRLFAEAGAELPVADFKIESAKFDVVCGGMLQAGIANNFLYAGILATGAISYEFSDVPIDTYLRLGAGVGLSATNSAVALGFAYSGAIGATYMF